MLYWYFFNKGRMYFINASKDCILNQISQRDISKRIKCVFKTKLLRFWLILKFIFSSEMIPICQIKKNRILETLKYKMPHWSKF